MPLQRWYLIQTKPVGETVAQANLTRQGYEVYLPRLVCRTRFRGVWRERIGALFPRYLFLRLDEGRQPFGPIRSTIGVSGVVRFGPRYPVVPDEVIHDLRRRADPATGLHALDRRPLPAQGTPVRIMMAPFDGLEGIFDREVGAERVAVLLKILGRETPVHVPANVLMPAFSY